MLMTYAILFRMKDIKEETAARKTEMEARKKMRDGSKDRLGDTR